MIPITTTNRRKPMMNNAEAIQIFCTEAQLEIKKKYGKQIKEDLEFRLKWELEWQRDWIAFRAKKLLLMPGLDKVYQQVHDEITMEWADRETIKVEKEIRKVKSQLEYLKNIGKDPEKIKDKITEAKVIRAKEYPLDKIIDINRAGFAKCVWHSDKNPSMFCKKNFAHCFSCNKSGDTIAVIMQLEGLTFKEAVLKLQ